jgi:DNA (cytosine-5)-methyltransferase 1
MRASWPVPVIDLFAGPGGLGEGFSALTDAKGENVFKVRLSIESDPFAHSTLELRAFYRQFPRGTVPNEYYQLLRHEITRESLFSRFPKQRAAAHQESWNAELGAEPHATVKDRVRKAIGTADRWILIGGPPCQAYSVVGRARRRSIKGYVPEDDHRQTLYREYLKTISDHWPSVFVMENVKGLLSAKLDGQRVFDRILSDLQSPARASRDGSKNGSPGKHYTIYSLTDHGKLMTLDPEDYVIAAERHGIPQSRHRIILFGIRNDLPRQTPNALPLRTPVPLYKVLEDLPRLRSGLSRMQDTGDSWLGHINSAKGRRWLQSARRIAGDKVYWTILDTIDGITAPRRGRGGEFISTDVSAGYEREWFADQRLEGVCNHRTKAHMPSDLHRYLYAACFGQVHGRSPRLRDFPADLMPDHANAYQAAATGTGMFSDRFRVQLRDNPGTTVTSHIHKDGHYYIHYDPSQCRSLTVREAARIQTFPDNYVFCGPLTQQYIQVGNAVPPLLAREIARIAWQVLA